MAKTLYLTAYQSEIHRGNNDAKLNGTASFWHAMKLSEVHGVDNTGTAVTAACTTVTGPTNGIEVINSVSSLPIEWISDALSADFTIAGTITGNLWARESTAAANAAINFCVDKIDRTTGALTRIATSVRTTELTTASAVGNFTVTPTSTVCNRGDRLRVRVFADDAGTMGNALTVTLNYDKGDPTQGESYVQFTENLTFETDFSEISDDGSAATVFGSATGSEQLAQPFTIPAGGKTILQVGAFLLKTGSPADNVVVEILNDSASLPGTTVIATVATYPSSSITGSFAGQNIWTVNIPLAAGNYWMSFRRSGALDAANNYSLNDGSATGSTFGTYRKGSAASGWGSATTRYAMLRLDYQPDYSVGTTYYLTDTAETINPGAATEKKALRIRGTGSVNSITNTAAGPTAGIQTTATAGGTAIEWYTPPLNAISLGGKCKFLIRGLESSASANASLKVEVAVTANDGTSATLWGIANLEPITTYGLLGEINVSDTTYNAWVIGDDTAITTGQRLRFRIYVDDCGSGALVTAFTVTVSYNGTTAAAAGDTYIMLPVAIMEQGKSIVAETRRIARNSLLRR